MAESTDIKHWKLSKVGTVGNKFEEDIVSQALERRGIPFLIRRYSDTAYDGLFIPQKGWAAVMVPAEFMERAQAVIENLKKDFESKA
jgi:hypothetical protein